MLNDFDLYNIHPESAEIEKIVYLQYKSRLCLNMIEMQCLQTDQNLTQLKVDVKRV